jgi:hypothetical protein
VNLDLFQVQAGRGYQRLKSWVLIRFPFDKQLFVVEILNSWTERKSLQMHQAKDIIGETRCIGVMLPDLQVTFVVQQAIKHMG